VSTVWSVILVLLVPQAAAGIGIEPVIL